MSDAFDKYVTSITEQERENTEDFKHIAKWYIIDAMGDTVYFRKRERKDAQAICDEMYGKGKYTIKTSGIDKGKEGVTCKGYLNSKSLAGQRMMTIRNNQGR